MSNRTCSSFNYRKIFEKQNIFRKNFLIATQVRGQDIVCKIIILQQLLVVLQKIEKKLSLIN